MAEGCPSCLFDLGLLMLSRAGGDLFLLGNQVEGGVCYGDRLLFGYHWKAGTELRQYAVVIERFDRECLR